MSQVSLLVINPSNIKLILKSHSLCFLQSFIHSRHLSLFLLLDTVHSPSDNILVSFQGIAFPECMQSWWEIVPAPSSQPLGSQADKVGCTSSQPVHGVSRWKLWRCLWDTDLVNGTLSSSWESQGRDARICMVRRTSLSLLVYTLGFPWVPPPSLTSLPLLPLCPKFKNSTKKVFFFLSKT